MTIEIGEGEPEVKRKQVNITLTGELLTYLEMVSEDSEWPIPMVIRYVMDDVRKNNRIQVRKARRS